MLSSVRRGASRAGSAVRAGGGHSTSSVSPSAPNARISILTSEDWVGAGGADPTASNTRGVNSQQPGSMSDMDDLFSPRR